jgi:hypothetical protein
MPNLFSVFLWNAALTGSRRLSMSKRQAGAVVSASWRTTREEGYADAQITLTGRPSDVSGLVKGARIEFFARDDSGVNQRLYRGYIDRIQGRRGGTNQARSVVVTLYGIFTLVGKLRAYQRYAYPTGKDISWAFSEIGSRWATAELMRENWPTPVFQGYTVGQLVDSFDAWDKPLSEVCSDLTGLSGGFATSGCDVVSETLDANIGKDRISIKPFDLPPTATNYVQALTLPIPDPTVRVGERQSDDDKRRLVNILRIRGGAVRYPNLLAQAVDNNTGFEFPTFGTGQGNGASTGNLLIDPGFEAQNTTANVLAPPGGASFKSASLDEGASDGGTWMVLLDNVNESVTQTVQNGLGLSLQPGDTYVYAPRMRVVKGSSIGCQARVRIQWYDNSSTLLKTDTITYDNTNTNIPLIELWATFPVVAQCPTGAVKAVCSVTNVHMVGSSGNHDGILIDNQVFYDAAITYQAGWEADIEHAGFVEAAHWAYDADASPMGGGAYSIYLKVAGITVIGNTQQVSLRPIAAARFPVARNQFIRVGIWVKSPPGETATPQIEINVGQIRSDGHYLGTQTQVYALSASPLTVWTLYSGTFQLDSECDNVVLNYNIQSNGALLFDDAFATDAAADPTRWYESNQYQITVRSDDTSLSTPTNYYPPDTPSGTITDIQGSIAAYGPNPDAADVSVIATDQDAFYYAAAYFAANALPVLRPQIVVIGRPVTIWPGQYVGAMGAEASEILPTGPLPLQEINGDWSSGVLSTRLFLGQERESEIRRSREIARRIAAQTFGIGRADGPSSGGGSSAGSIGPGVGGVGISVAVLPGVVTAPDTVTGAIGDYNGTTAFVRFQSQWGVTNPYASDVFGEWGGETRWQYSTNGSTWLGPDGTAATFYRVKGSGWRCPQGYTSGNLYGRCVNVNATGIAAAAVASAAVAYTAPVATAGVTAFNTRTGPITIASAGATITITEPTTGNFNIEDAGGGGGSGLQPITDPNDTSVPGVNLWLAADLLPVVANGTGISAWNDGSANAHNYVQATGANQWLYENNVLNGLPCARAAGSSFMTGPLASVPLSDFTIFIVVRPSGSNNATTGRLFGLDDSGSANNALGLYGTGFGSWIIRNGASPFDVIIASSAAPPQDGFANLITLEMSSVQGSRYFQGETLSARSVGTAYTVPPSLTAMHLGSPGLGGTAPNWFSGDLFEFIVYSRPLTLTERMRVWLYLSNKWGI